MELRDYLHGLRRYWVAIVLMTLVGVLAAWGWAATQKPVYAASASAYIATSEDGANSVGPGVQSATFAQTFVDSFTSYAGWQSTADHVIDALKLNSSPRELASHITVTNTQNTAILAITATAATPDQAEQLANAWVKGLQATIDTVNGTGKAGSAPVNVFLGDPATASQKPIFPDTRTALLVGGVIGLGFGVAFALIRAASDRRIRNGDEVADKLGHAVVGTLPEMPVNGKKSKRGPNNAFAFPEAMRVLRTNLQFMDVDHPPRTIVVTSPVPGDGKSTVATELARTLAASGAPVILVDGDLRRSTVAQKMGLPGGAGLSDVLAGRAEVTALLQRVPDMPNLLVLTAGMVPPNPSEVLGSERMHTLLRDLSAEATVIIDAPPLLPVTDGAVLTHQADGALLVVSVGKTTYDLAEKSLEALKNARGRALGIVLNRAPLRGVDASPYAYAYYRGYGKKPAETEAEPVHRRSTAQDLPTAASTPLIVPASSPAPTESPASSTSPAPSDDDLAAWLAPTVAEPDAAAVPRRAPRNPRRQRTTAAPPKSSNDITFADGAPLAGEPDTATGVFTALLGENETPTPRKTRERTRRS
ncbi:polysaccharide biosynthesis tyrosine autokinase [Microbacterium terrisoli]|jgi:capsular exopolysaccharide synthesis family protein|uniref:polysaccharide biosynthesis tyrosine autokinase n=1 Tax=Microbacterium terrisoli TaxID=3242192 RepID=UPI002805FA3D|nr:polysaccharide biosynthesis tyrosine autokinase [Microbacterium protaetiae]